MPEERKVYRSPARAATKARPAQTAAPRPPQPPQKPKRRSAKRRRSRIVLGLCLLCLAVVLVVSVVMVRCTAEPGGPAEADFGTPAAAWQKNELGYYFNASGGAIPAAVLKGMDVSKFQGEVNWETAKAAGIDFAIIRCGFGGEWDGAEENWAQDDPQWRRNADECTRLGIPFGTYLYSYATTVEEARSEADHVARLLGLTAPPQEGLDDYTASPYRLSYPVYYDLEDKYISGVFPSEMAEITKAFFDRLQEHGYTGEQGVYASLNWVRARFSDPGFDPWRDNLWIARFSDELGYAGTYDMWQSTYSAPGADYGVQSETVDLDFVMRPFTFTGVSACNGKTAAPVLQNDTRTDELHMDGKDAYATLETNEPDEEAGGRRVYWTTSDKSVATVDKNGTVRARTDSGECTITATLADGTESRTCLVRVGDITVPIFATAGLRGDRTTLADAAALKASTPDSILLDAGDALHGTQSASLTGGMDMLSAFSAAGYDLQAMALNDFAYGTTRLVSDANMGSGPSLASNLLNNEATAVFYRSTSWNRNRVTNGMYTIVERAGYKIGFFALNDPAQAAGISAANGEFITARDWTDTANEQIAALQNAGCDAIIAIAATAPGGDWQKALLNSGVTAIIDGTAAENGTNVLGAAQGLGGIARLDLVFTQGGSCRAVLQSAVTAEAMESSRSTWLEMAAAQAQTDTAADTADPGKDTAAAGGKDTAAPTETADAARQAGADAYVYAAAKIAALDADDQSILYTPLFTYAENPDASRTISFGNYLAALYAEAVANDTASGLPEGAAVEALAGGVTEPEYGEITRGDLMAALPATARIQLVSISADATKTLADSGSVSRVYQSSLTEYTPAGDTAYIVTDTATLAALNADYTVLRDYGDVFWAVRMNINDLTNNFAENFTLPEAPQYGVGRRG
ncbi:GH25 family lysozyme [uncultured Gemmiger sp.]|uniref:GH25 family lysozyme n=1 Tax=uncultured Gemmiger sp. TaxID=1623490 RepID=UPI0025FC00BB|nr:GH25 family lysozyme [uncultured Gemmiger sp.]